MSLTEITTSLPDIPPIDASEIAALVSSIGGAAGGSAMGITILASQLIMLGLKSNLGQYAGKYRLAALYGITAVLGVTSLKVAGLGWMAAAVHANTLASFQVFGHQILKQMKEKK